MKAGVSLQEPEGNLAGDGHLRMNIDKGQQSNGGANALVLGTVASTIPCGELPRYELKTLSSGDRIMAETDDRGVLWLIFGSDSGFESLTSLYYTRVSVTPEPMNLTPGDGKRGV